MDTTLAMELKYSADVELQVQELDPSKERCDASTIDLDTLDNKTKALVEDWDTSHNLENPRN
jgi:hypothetical protein